MTPRTAPDVTPDVKQQLLSVATRLFSDRGFSGTSIQAVADEVGITKPSLLYHFPSKEILREAVLNDLLGQWEARLPQVLAAATAGTDRFDAVFGEAAAFFQEDPNRARLILREVVDRPKETRERLGSRVSPWVRLLTDAIRTGQEAGRVRADVDPEAWLIEVVVLVIGTYAAADLAYTVFPPADSDARGRHSLAARQLQEISRIARISLFVSTEVNQ
jgi:AcrR family transcriptional regulator